MTYLLHKICRRTIFNVKTNSSFITASLMSVDNSAMTTFEPWFIPFDILDIL